MLKAYGKILLLCTATFILIGTTQAFAQHADTEKSTWYIGFGLGSGDGGWTDDDGEKITFKKFSDGADDRSTMTLDFGVGAILTNNFNIGFNVNYIDHYGTYAGYEFDVSIMNMMCMLTFFPMEEGLFLRAGIGTSRLYQKIESYGTNYVDGYGALLGAGYYFKLTKTFNLGLNFDYSVQKYSKSGYPKDSHAWAVYLSFYWF
jgi:hypothetical protein